jgi:hypothetical protein
MTATSALLKRSPRDMVAGVSNPLWGQTAAMIAATITMVASSSMHRAIHSSVARDPMQQRRGSQGASCSSIMPGRDYRHFAPASLPVRVGARALNGEIWLMLGPQVAVELYLRKDCCAFVLLCRVRRDLLNIKRPSTSVARTARRWIFTHMGQLSRDYHLLFGESPSSTLARSRLPKTRGRELLSGQLRCSCRLRTAHDPTSRYSRAPRGTLTCLF